MLARPVGWRTGHSQRVNVTVCSVYAGGFLHNADRWRDACAELDAATVVPWVLLSGGVDGSTFESQARVACEAGASGVLVGRSIWAEAATLQDRERTTFLETEGRARLGRLATIVNDVGVPWESRSPLVAGLSEPTDAWYRDP